MLPKHSRLTKQTIEKNLVRARRLKTSSFLVMYTTLPLKGVPRVSVTVSKKLVSRAVMRNKLRRRGYAALSPIIPRLSPGSAILISYTVANAKTPLAEIRTELTEALVKTGLLSQ